MGILSPHRLSAGCGLELSSYKYLNSHHLLCIRLFDLQMTENLIQIGLSREKKKKEFIGLGTAICQARSNFRLP